MMTIDEKADKRTKKILLDIEGLADERTIKVLQNMDELAGLAKNNKLTDGDRKQLLYTINWIKEHFDLDELECFFESHKDKFKNISCLQDFISVQKSGVYVDVIDQIIFYRVENEAGDFDEIFRIEKNGGLFYKGNLIRRNKELYDNLIVGLGS